MQKEMLIVGGPNGAGKTTFAIEYVARYGCTYLGADAIAAEMSPDDPARAAIAAGRQFLEDLQMLLSSGESFIVESTLSGKTFVSWINDAKSLGFKITLFYLFLDSPETCIERVHERVQKGGHFVPDADIRRRFGRTYRNFWQLYRPLSDDWTLIYNAESQERVAARGSGPNVSVVDQQLFVRFHSLADESPDD